ncbi:class I adenylate-forming enzyme family protein [Nocardia noduli]|uniref:class I adenylate-forming enzyme family protein n=1 Tax=Nocardia noduli TaxID=2815722 RepID=UPI001C22B3AE|nr:class I adenylate-forming enzyme family protein [Nocardia noduli]
MTFGTIANSADGHDPAPSSRSTARQSGTSLEPTRPRSAASAERYRREGYWLQPQPLRAPYQELRAGGDRTALIDNSSAWSYRQLAEIVTSISARLSITGLRPGDPVLIIAPLTNAAVAAYLGVLYSGHVAVLLDRRCGVSDVRHANTAARPPLTLAGAADAERLALRDHGTVLTFDDLSATALTTATSEPDDAALLDFDAAAVVLFTSGTTGTPKGVVHSRNTLRSGAANMAKALDFTSSDIPFLSSPLAGITGVIQLEMALHAHATLVLENVFEPAASLTHILDHDATIIGGAPVIIEQLFKECDNRQLDTLPLRSIALGGTAIPRRLTDAAVARGIAPIRVYGSSEVPFSTCSPVRRDAPASGSDEGFPLPGVDIAVRDDKDYELLVSGPHRFLGYLDPAHNTDAFDDEWVRTGDQADIIEGRLTIKGRLKEIVARKGMKISLAEIDEAASVLNDLGESVAYGVPDPETGERLVLALRCVSPSGLEFSEIIGRLLDAGLAKWKLPEQIVLWHVPFPRTESGKIQRREVAARAADKASLLAPRLEAPSSR